MNVESHLVRQIERRGGIAEKMTSLSRRGFFDRLIIMPGGRIVFAELKKPKGGRLSPHQKRRIEEFLARGCVCVVLQSVEQVDHFLASLDRAMAATE